MICSTSYVHLQPIYCNRLLLYRDDFKTIFVDRHGVIPKRDRNGFERTGSLRPGTTRRGDQIIRTPKNVKIEQQPLEISPRLSTLCHVLPLQTPNRSVNRILHLNLHFYPYNIIEIPRSQLSLITTRLNDLSWIICNNGYFKTAFSVRLI